LLKNDCKRFFGEEVVEEPVEMPVAEEVVAPEVTEVAPEVTEVAPEVTAPADNQ
jgi:hypothetical protein